MIFESIIGKYEKISFLVYKTKIHIELKCQKKNFLGKFDSYKTFIKKIY